MNKGLIKEFVLVSIGTCISFFGCGREWVPEAAGPCIDQSDCLSGYWCINQRCVQWEYSETDGGTRLKEFGEACQDNQECHSDYCLLHPEGGFCTQPC